MSYGEDDRNPYRVLENDYEPPIIVTDKPKPGVTNKPVIKNPVGGLSNGRRGFSGRLYIAAAVIIAAFIISAGLNPAFFGLSGKTENENDNDNETIVLDNPEIIAPLNNAVITYDLPELVWSPVHNADNYIIELWTSMSYAHPMNLTSMAYHYQILTPLSDSTYHWRTRAVNGTTYGNWSSISTFNIKTSISTPIIDSPNDGKVVFKDDLSFSWSLSEDCDLYRLQISNRSDFHMTLLDVLVHDNEFSAPLYFEENTTYYWRVSANLEDIWGEWSKTDSFITGIEIYTCSHEWKFEKDDSIWSYPFTISGENYYDYQQLVRYDVLPADYSKYITADDPTIVDIASYLNAQAAIKGYSRYESIWLALNFVQSIGYEYDIDSKGVVEYARYPIETLKDSSGDCEDLAALYVSLVRAMGYDAVMLHIHGLGLNHIGTAVASIPMPSNMTYNYVIYGGERYYYCETTCFGWVPGVMPNDLDGSSITVVP